MKDCLLMAIEREENWKGIVVLFRVPVTSGFLTLDSNLTTCETCAVTSRLLFGFCTGAMLHGRKNENVLH